MIFTHFLSSQFSLLHPSKRRDYIIFPLFFPLCFLSSHFLSSPIFLLSKQTLKISLVQIIYKQYILSVPIYEYKIWTPLFFFMAVYLDLLKYLMPTPKALHCSLIHIFFHTHFISLLSRFSLSIHPIIDKYAILGKNYFVHIFLTT